VFFGKHVEFQPYTSLDCLNDLIGSWYKVDGAAGKGDNSIILGPHQVCHGETHFIAGILDDMRLPQDHDRSTGRLGAIRGGECRRGQWNATRLVWLDDILSSHGVLFAKHLFARQRARATCYIL